MTTPRATITAMQYCLPPRVLGQEELAARFGEKQVADIAKLSGITERRIAEPDVTSVDLAECAARRLMAAHAIEPDTIEMIIFASQTGDYQLPASACVLHGRLGLPKTCGAFDIGLGCSAFPYALSVANGLIASGTVKGRVLLINADTLTHIIHPQDRGLVPLHGDGAVAALLEPTTGEDGLLGFELGSDGSGAEHLVVPASGARRPRTAETSREIVDTSGSVTTDEHLHMNGPAVFQFSIREVPAALKRAFEKWQIAPAELDLLVLHQANRMMLDLIYKKAGIGPEQQFFFMEKVGNMSGASSPMALAEAWRSGRLKPGTLIAVAAFGVGLSWGAALIRLPDSLADCSAAPVDYSPED
ncbi:ketoacyl-ACP synthase III [Ruficoccus sp. ZRK36]|uniref:3-oxoacyl-ACP synthase III family protein n=1 Tax=Ruficoccus sp. ZRK36 TaxID=2866311 RepID=UPI001C72C005|nr:ketoacyl-ACP synthase III [Ruficoccus sp. ZRK36]QYY36186.1 ketoacyl-ACP synthase III [Ruficoccus sp. ZRK36]